MKSKKLFKPRKDCEGDFPPIEDSRWEVWAVPVEDLLITPKTFKELRAWSKEKRVGTDSLRNILAWLKFNNRIRCLPFKQEGKLTWIWKRN